MELPNPSAFQLPVKSLQIGLGGYIRGHADCFLDMLIPQRFTDVNCLDYGRIIAVQPILQRQDGLYTLVLFTRLKI
ncbi:TPA: hypothetical protein EYP66_06640 [Candidatus Poribacteria bacterium]|nr:hypothetical protein [Candidatus Poribacteria bacterium]